MEDKIPLLRPYFDSEELEEIQKVLDSGWVSQGPKVKEFEDKIAEYLGVKYHDKVYKSDRIDKTYDWCKKALEKNIAYICNCPANEWRESYKLKQRPCPHRDQPIETNLDEWEKQVNNVLNSKQIIKVGIVGKYFDIGDFLDVRKVSYDCH